MRVKKVFGLRKALGLEKMAQKEKLSVMKWGVSF